MRKEEITQLLAGVEKGEGAGVGKLASLAYEELRRLASRYLRNERSDHTLQTTALVHEAYLKLARTEDLTLQDRAHLVGVAAHAMRQILVEHARAHKASKRGGQHHYRVELTDEIAPLSAVQPIDLIALDQALERLSALSRRQGQVVEMRFFGGLSVEETAELLEVSVRSVKNDWTVARAWLRRELDQSAPHKR